MIFVLNNRGYLIERLLCKHGEREYNDVASWNYQQLPAALGCENWFTARVTTCGELDQAIAHAEEREAGGLYRSRDGHVCDFAIGSEAS